MKYNEKYDRYIDDDLVIYRWDKSKDKLVQCNQHITSCGYMQMRTKISQNYVHRIIWETFNGEIPQVCEIDHINTIRTDNRLDNLRVVTRKENQHNPLTVEHKLSALKKTWEVNRGRKLSEEHRKKLSEASKRREYKPSSEFGRKYFDHYGYSKRENSEQYRIENRWYRKHNNKCSWEVDDVSKP